MGLNVQRGVMLAGYGIFPSVYLSTGHHFEEPQPGEDRLTNSSSEHSIYRMMRWVVVAVAVLCFLIVILY